jgi:hypothetical protein
MIRHTFSMFLWSFLQLVAETPILRELGAKGNAGARVPIVPVRMQPHDCRMRLLWSAVIVLVAQCAAFAQTSNSCKQFSFAGEVRAGQTYARAIGNELSFRLTPDHSDQMSGWYFEIGPTNPLRRNSLD